LSVGQVLFSLGGCLSPLGNLTFALAAMQHETGGTMTKIYLNVGYAEKDQVKNLGARWDLTREKWYVPLGTDYKSFERWLPNELKDWANEKF
jgi:hypothetical protein